MMSDIPSPSDFFAYSSQDRSLAIVNGLAGTLSMLTAGTLVIHLVYLLVQTTFPREGNARAGARDVESARLRRQVTMFLLALFCADVFQSLGGLIQIRWASKGGIAVESISCKVQGVALMGGDLMVSYFNVVMAVHTFLTIVMMRSMTMLTASIIIIVGIGISVALTVIGPTLVANDKGPFYGVAGLWCFIRDPYSSPRFWLHYFPIWISCGTIAVIYAACFWILRKRHRTPGATDSTTGAPHNPNAPRYDAVSYKLLWYPTSYIIIILPLSVARLLQATGKSPPSDLLKAGITILMLSGFIDSIIYVTTRKGLSPFQYFSNPFSRMPFIGGQRRRRGSQRANDFPVIWVQTEQHRHGGDSKYSVDLSSRQGSKATDDGVKFSSLERTI